MIPHTSYFFTHCIVTLWNSLPQEVAMATNLDGFKRGLDKFLEANAINDGYVLPPVSEAVSLCAPVAGEDGWEGAVAPCWSLVDGWLTTV